jgi:hypothetical protein
VALNVDLNKTATRFTNFHFTLEKWVKSVLVPLFKKGSVEDTSNYRGISLISHNSENSPFSLTHVFSFEYIDFIRINRLPDIPHFNNFCHKI